MAAKERDLRQEADALPRLSRQIEIDPLLFRRYKAQIQQLEQGLTDRTNASESPAALAVRFSDR